ncbi:MAG: hypothetical protein IPK16_18350 [Anaerolineales bacterium]|nr:hypothetical protein [Anaerolineales bacterium]
MSRHANRLAQRYSTTFEIRLVDKERQYSELLETQPMLLREVTAFRGGSYFTCGVIDAAETGPDQIKTADLFSLIANAALDPISDAEFWESVQRGTSTGV